MFGDFLSVPWGFGVWKQHEMLSVFLFGFLGAWVS